LQRLYAGEAFTLQIDSHHRFAPHWDASLIQMLEQTDSPKPIVGTYACGYDPRTNKKHDQTAYQMVAERFTKDGTILFRPRRIEGCQDLTRPFRARFVSGHFFFTLGKHCDEYRYDPQLYFAGDEIRLSIRSFTLGYDLFHPQCCVLWHEYTRAGRPKHWDDHSTKNRKEIDTLWHERDVISKRRLRKILREEENDIDLTGYELGEVRTHQQYERYAGIDFAGRRLHRETLAGTEPPCTFTDVDSWEKALVCKRAFRACWDPKAVELPDDCKFVYFGLEGRDGKVIHRHDARPDSPEAGMRVNHLDLEIDAVSDPNKLIVWPVSKSQGWLKKYEFLC